MIPPASHRLPSPALLAGILACALAWPVAAQDPEPAEDGPRDDGKSRELPALDMLTTGSVLRGVTFPQYSAERVLLRMLEAGQLVLRDRRTIDAEDVRIRAFDPSGRENSLIRLASATLEDRAVLRSSTPVSIESPKLSARGQGIVYEIESGKGFLRGPVRVETEIDRSISMNPLPKLPTAMAAAAVVAASAQAEPDPAEPRPRDTARLSEQEVAGLDRLAESRAEGARRAAEEAERTTAEAQAESDKARQELRTFLAEMGEKDPQGPKADLSTEVPRAEIPPSQAPAADGEDKPMQVTVESAGGAYFDPEARVLVFLDKVLFRSDDGFTLSGADEVKVFFEEEKAPAKPASGAGEPAKAGGDDPFGGGKFGRAKLVVATGTVVAKGVRKADRSKGETRDRAIEASGRQFVFNIDSHELIVRGGRPWFISPDLSGYIDDPQGYFIVDTETMRGSVNGTLKAFATFRPKDEKKNNND